MEDEFITQHVVPEKEHFKIQILEKKEQHRSVSRDELERHNEKVNAWHRERKMQK